MANGVVFIAGVYGVGKSHLCELASAEMDIPFFSAGDLISEYNGEIYGVNKKVSDAGNNQEILIRSIEERIKEKEIILAGHMCVFDKKGEIVRIDLNQLSKMHIKKLILLTANADKIYENLLMRDKVSYSFSTIEELIRTEEEQFFALSDLINIPANVIEMTYSEQDLADVKNVLWGECK